MIGTISEQVKPSCRDASEGLELVAALVAPYLQIKEVRRELQVKQTCLRDSLPPSVSGRCRSTLNPKLETL